MRKLVGALHAPLVFDRRTRVLSGHLAAMLPREASVLDVGCGDGTISAMIGEQRPDVTIRGVDVLLRPQTHIPVELFDGKVLPAADKSVDAVMFVDVLHHTEDPMVLLREAARVARRQVLIKDHTMDGPLAGTRLRFMDWVGNAPHGVVLPYNYWPEARWRQGFAALGLTITEWRRDIGLYPFPASLLFGRGLHCVVALAP
jgi:SAM-dependent methyltransferase